VNEVLHQGERISSPNARLLFCDDSRGLLAAQGAGTHFTDSSVGRVDECADFTWCGSSGSGGVHRRTIFGELASSTARPVTFFSRSTTTHWRRMTAAQFARNQQLGRKRNCACDLGHTRHGLVWVDYFLTAMQAELSRMPSSSKGPS
jgi:hypothetical protein